VVARLQERGLAVRLAGDGGYVPKDPQTAMSEWKRRYLNDLEEAAVLLQREMVGPGAYVVWNVDSTSAVREQGARLLGDSRSHVSLAAPAAVMDLWSSELRGAADRGVLLKLISYGLPEESLRPLLDRMYPDGSSMRGGAMAVDRRVALFVTSVEDGGGLQGAWTDNPAIAGVAEEYVDDKLVVEQMLESRRSPWGDTDY